MPPREVQNAINVSFACALAFLPDDPPGRPNTDPMVLTLVAVGAEYAFPLSIGERAGGGKEKTVVDVATRFKPVK